MPDPLSTSIAIASLLVAALALFTSRKQQIISTNDTLNEIYNAFNAVVLSSDDNIKAASEIHNFIPNDLDLFEQRKCWLSFLMFNGLQAAWIGQRNGNVSRTDLDVAAKTHLPSLLSDPIRLELLQNAGYSDGFVEFCLGHAPDQHEDSTRQNAA